MVFLFFLSQAAVLIFFGISFFLTMNDSSAEVRCMLLPIIILYIGWLLLSWGVFFDNYSIKVLLEAVK